MNARAGVVVVVTLGALALPAAVSGAADDPYRLLVTNRGLTEKASPGSSCVTRPDGATLCSDAGYPLKVRGRLPIRPRSRLLLRTGVAATQLTVRTVRVRGQKFKNLATLRVRRLDKTGRRWLVRLPRKLRGANVVEVFVQWTAPGGGGNDADFWAGIKRER